MRMSLGLVRTECSCVDCQHWCNYMPGFLIPDDVERLYRLTKKEVQSLEEWAEIHLVSSDGYLMKIGSEIVRLPTLAPVQKYDSLECHWFENGKCKVHEASPFGCAFFDSHMTKEEGSSRSYRGAMELFQEWSLSDSDYAYLWNHLKSNGKIGIPSILLKTLGVFANEDKLATS